MKWARIAVAYLICAMCALAQPQWRQSPGYRAYQKGNALFIAHKFPESEAAIDEALRLDPKLVPALTLKAKLAMASNRFDMARRTLEQALAVDPNSGYAEFLYGMDAYVTSDLRLALPRFEKARHLSPADPRVALYLGFTSEALGQTEQALSYYEEAVRLEQSAGAPQAATFLAGSRLLLLMGRQEDCGRWIAQALKVEPGSRDGHFESARLLLIKGEAAQAAREGETALVLHGGDATDAQIHYLLIRAYRDSGSPAQAARHADILRLLDAKAPR
jgi:tetratricopeptide (TPR) repeat protein